MLATRGTQDSGWIFAGRARDYSSWTYERARAMFRFTIRDLVWLTCCTSLVLGWVVSLDRQARHGPRLVLRSGYSADGLLSSANPHCRSIQLLVRLDEV